MSNEQLEAAIESAWENRDAITPATQGETREAIEDTLNALDSGSLRVAQKLDDGSWHVNQWAKKAVLLGGCAVGRAVSVADQEPRLSDAPIRVGTLSLYAQINQ